MPFCEKCGHEVNSDQLVCLNCGCEIKHHPNTAVYNQPQVAKTDSSDYDSADIFALVGFIGIFMCLGPIAIVFSALGLKSKKNHGLALAGLIVSIAEIVLIILIPILWYVLISMGTTVNL